MRRRYLVCYDIREPRRLRETHKVMKAFGSRLQYSVYLADLTRAERVRMMDALRSVANAAADSVVVIDLGKPSDQARMVERIGPEAVLRDLRATIV